MITKHNKNFPDSKCEIEGCSELARRIIRTKLVCRNCYSILLRDNIRRFKKDLDITDSLEIHKSCYKYKCIKKIPTFLKYVNGELMPKYCSKECEVKDKEIDEKYRNEGLLHKQDKDTISGSWSKT